jgi:hypothetical protein
MRDTIALQDEMHSVLGSEHHWAPLDQQPAL